MFEQIISSMLEENIIFKGKEESVISKLKVVYELGFTKLLDSLATDKRNRLDFVTELNFIYQLHHILTSKDIDFELIYEPEKDCGSPDLLLTIDGFSYWFQIKRYSNLKVDNIANKTLSILQDYLEQIEKNLFYSIDHSDFLIESDIEILTKNIDDVVEQISDGFELECRLDHDRYLYIDFFSPNKKTFTHLTYAGSIGSGRFVGEEITEHVRRSILKGMKAINWKFDENCANILVVDGSHKHYEIDIGEVLYGTEQYCYRQGKQWFQRDNDGLIDDESIKDKLSGFVLLDGDRLICDFDMKLFTMRDVNMKNLDSILEFSNIYNRQMII